MVPGVRRTNNRLIAFFELPPSLFQGIGSPHSGQPAPSSSSMGLNPATPLPPASPANTSATESSPIAVSLDPMPAINSGSAAGSSPLLLSASAAPTSTQSFYVQSGAQNSQVSKQAPDYECMYFFSYLTHTIMQKWLLKIHTVNYRF